MNGYIVKETRDEARLSNAIGSRTFKTELGARGFMRQVLDNSLSATVPELEVIRADDCIEDCSRLGSGRLVTEEEYLAAKTESTIPERS